MVLQLFYNMTNHKAFDVYQKQCPSRNVLSLIGDKWSILIITLLSSKIYRFGELQRAIDGISKKVLTQTLVKLERSGFIARNAYPVLPLKVEYSLTTLGKELNVILTSLTEWIEHNMPDILQAEKNFLDSKTIVEPL